MPNQSKYNQFATEYYRRGADRVSLPEKNPVGVLSDQEYRGLKVFMGQGKCINCHKGPEFTSAASSLLNDAEKGGVVSRMVMGNGAVKLYDEGFYNIGVTKTEWDRGRGALDARNMPLAYAGQLLKALSTSVSVPNPFCVNSPLFDPFCVDTNTFEANPGQALSSTEAIATQGSFKVPTLLSVALTAPYMHNGSLKSLEEVVEFYDDGGVFHDNNAADRDADIERLGLSAKQQGDLVAFLKSLTDYRAVYDQAPFDHPALRIPNGHPGNEYRVMARFPCPIVNNAIPGASPTCLATDSWINLPAVGRSGGPGRPSFYDNLAN